MKKTILILSAIALVLILLVAGGLWYFISRLPKVKTPEAPADLETYLAEKWTMYRLRSWNEDTGELVLEYPQKLTYEQFCKYGAELDFDADALAQKDRLEDLCLGIETRLKQQLRGNGLYRGPGGKSDHLLGRMKATQNSLRQLPQGVLCWFDYCALPVFLGIKAATRANRVPRPPQPSAIQPKGIAGMVVVVGAVL